MQSFLRCNLFWTNANAHLQTWMPSDFISRQLWTNTLRCNYHLHYVTTKMFLRTNLVSQKNSSENERQAIFVRRPLLRCLFLSYLKKLALWWRGLQIAGDEAVQLCSKWDLAGFLRGFLIDVRLLSASEWSGRCELVSAFEDLGGKGGGGGGEEGRGDSILYF